MFFLVLRSRSRKESHNFVGARAAMRCGSGSKTDAKDRFCKNVTKFY
jgi:hypothetical protein